MALERVAGVSAWNPKPESLGNVKRTDETGEPASIAPRSNVKVRTLLSLTVMTMAFGHTPSFG